MTDVLGNAEVVIDGRAFVLYRSDPAEQPFRSSIRKPEQRATSQPPLSQAGGKFDETELDFPKRMLFQNWQHGAGQANYDLSDADAERFWKSRNIDVSQPGIMRLGPQYVYDSMNYLGTHLVVGPGMGDHVNDACLWMNFDQQSGGVYSNQLIYYAPPVGTGHGITWNGGNPGNPVTALATDGEYVWWACTSGVTDQGTLWYSKATGSAATKVADISNITDLCFSGGILYAAREGYTEDSKVISAIGTIELVGDPAVWTWTRKSPPSFYRGSSLGIASVQNKVYWGVSAGGVTKVYVIDIANTDAPFRDVGAFAHGFVGTCIIGYLDMAYIGGYFLDGFDSPQYDDCGAVYVLTEDGASELFTLEGEDGSHIRGLTAYGRHIYAMTDRDIFRWNLKRGGWSHFIGMPLAYTLDGNIPATQPWDYEWTCDTPLGDWEAGGSDIIQTDLENGSVRFGVKDGEWGRLRRKFPASKLSLSVDIGAVYPAVESRGGELVLSNGSNYGIVRLKGDQEQVGTGEYVYQPLPGGGGQAVEKTTALWMLYVGLCEWNESKGEWSERRYGPFPQGAFHSNPSSPSTYLYSPRKRNLRVIHDGTKLQLYIDHSLVADTMALRDATVHDNESFVELRCGWSSATSLTDGLRERITFDNVAMGDEVYSYSSTPITRHAGEMVFWENPSLSATTLVAALPSDATHKGYRVFSNPNYFQLIDVDENDELGEGSCYLESSSSALHMGATLKNFWSLDVEHDPLRLGEAIEVELLPDGASHGPLARIEAGNDGATRSHLPLAFRARSVRLRWKLRGIEDSVWSGRAVTTPVVRGATLNFMPPNSPVHEFILDLREYAQDMAERNYPVDPGYDVPFLWERAKNQNLVTCTTRLLSFTGVIEELGYLKARDDETPLEGLLILTIREVE